MICITIWWFFFFYKLIPHQSQTLENQRNSSESLSEIEELNHVLFIFEAKDRRIKPGIQVDY